MARWLQTASRLKQPGDLTQTAGPHVQLPTLHIFHHAIIEDQNCHHKSTMSITKEYKPQVLIQSHLFSTGPTQIVPFH